MGKLMEQAVERAIHAMGASLSETLTVDDMARTAMYSKFHFSRAFLKTTGISPARFLSAMRLQEAKRLLLSTPLPIVEISQRVGYASVGSFGSRFTVNVGVSPTSYRQLSGFTSQIRVDVLPDMVAPRPLILLGNILPPTTGDLGLIFVGLFPDRVPRGLPVRCAVLHRPGSYILEDVPRGEWYLLAHSVAAGHEEVFWGSPACVDDHFVGSHGPLTIGSDAAIEPVDVRLRPMRALDPPVLLALLDVRSVVRRGAEPTANSRRNGMAGLLG
jgi:AraC family transcriptional regulator